MEWQHIVTINEVIPFPGCTVRTSISGSVVENLPTALFFTIEIIPCPRFLQGSWRFILTISCQHFAGGRGGERSLFSDLAYSPTCSVRIVVCSPADILVIDRPIFWCLFLYILRSLYSYIVLRNGGHDKKELNMQR